MRSNGSDVQFIHAKETNSPPVSSPPPAQAAEVKRATTQEEKTVKPKLQPPPDKPIPSSFWRGGLYKVNCMLGRPDRVPALSKKEALSIASQQAAAAAEARQKRNEERLEAVFNTHRQKVHGQMLVWRRLRITIGVFGHAGSAGKTLTSVMYGNFISKLTKASVVVVAATKNTGSTTAKSGVARKNTLSLYGVEQLMEQHGDKLTADMVRDEIAFNEYGTYVLAQEPLPKDFTGMRLRRVVELLKKVFDVVVLDTGNNLAEEDGIELEAFHQCDLPIFVCAPYTKPESPVLMGETMDSYAKTGQKTKLSRSVVIINGTHPTDPPEKWAMYAESKVDDYGRPIGTRDFRFRVIKHNSGDTPSGKMFYNHHDPNLKHNPAPRVEDINQVTYRGYLEAFVEVTERAGAIQGRDFAILDAILEAEEILKSYDWRLAAMQETAEESEYDSDSDADTPTPAGDTLASTEGNYS